MPPHSLWVTEVGEGTPIVLLHGLSGSSRWWSRNLESLAKSHRVYAVDLVGFGRSVAFLDPPRAVPAFGEITALLGRWIETLGERVHLAGHSMGGAIAIRLTAERPELVRSLMLVDSSGVPFGFHPADHLRMLPRTPLRVLTIGSVLIPDLFRAGPTSVATASARVVLGDAREWMRAVQAPTLLVWGERDPFVPIRYAQEMQKEIRESRLVVVPGAGHVAMWDEPEKFNRLALDFFAEMEQEPERPALRGVFRWGVSGWSDGMAHRSSGSARDIVLVHGLGMSSSYFNRFAHELYDNGWSPIAPDLPGFGESVNAPASGPETHAAQLIAWAERLGIRDAVWLGHSLGANAVAHLAVRRPDLVQRAVFLGPLWSTMRHPIPRLVFDLLADALREPASLYRHILRAYWRAGMARFLGTLIRSIPDTRQPPEIATPVRMMAGRDDPIVDHAFVSTLDPQAVLDLPGAHACHYSHAEDTADPLRQFLGGRA